MEHPDNGFFDMPTIPDPSKKERDFFDARTLEDVPNAGQFERTRPVRPDFSALEPTIEAFRLLNSQTVYLLGEKEPRILQITRHRYLANVAYVRVAGANRTIIGQIAEGQKIDNPYQVKFSYWKEVFLPEGQGFK